MLDQLILVVDDDPVSLAAVATAVLASGFRVLTARNGREALREASKGEPDAVVVDLDLPDVDGVEVCRQLRRWSDAPIIGLVDDRRDAPEELMIEALDSGADECTRRAEPTSLLLARVRSLLRRRDPARPEVLHVGDMTVDVAGHVVLLAGEPVELQPREFAVLSALAAHAGRVVSLSLLERTVAADGRGRSVGNPAGSVRAAIALLRKELGEGERRPRIVNERAAGYRLTDPDVVV